MFYLKVTLTFKVILKTNLKRFLGFLWKYATQMPKSLANSNPTRQRFEIAATRITAISTLSSTNLEAVLVAISLALCGDFKLQRFRFSICTSFYRAHYFFISNEVLKYTNKALSNPSPTTSPTLPQPLRNPFATRWRKLLQSSGSLHICFCWTKMLLSSRWLRPYFFADECSEDSNYISTCLLHILISSLSGPYLRTWRGEIYFEMNFCCSVDFGRKLQSADFIFCRGFSSGYFTPCSSKEQRPLRNPTCPPQKEL